MNDKVEIAWPDVIWPGCVYGESRFWSLEPCLDHPKYIRADLYEAQAAEIERLRAQLRKVTADLNAWSCKNARPMR
jgi:hypothetical protein